MKRKRIPLIFSLLAYLPLYLWLACFPAMAQQTAQDSATAVILAYHRVGEDEYPDMNIRKEQFESHIEELLSGGYHVLPLEKIVAALQNGDSLPEHAVAITFDGGYRSVLENAIPLLEKNNMPYTLFISTDYTDDESSAYLRWSEIKNLSRSKLTTIGLHPASYTRLYDQPEKEIARQINKARTRFREETGKEATLFAYPFGELSQPYQETVKNLGFTAAFGQQSGAAYAGDDLFSLPRFPMTESYGDESRFQLAVRALPLPVTDLEPKNPLLSSSKPAIGFTIDKALESRISAISCFVSDQEKPEIQIIGNRRVELRLAELLALGRNRINCTLPVASQTESGDGNPAEQRWRWLGLQLIVPENANSLKNSL